MRLFNGSISYALWVCCLVGKVIDFIYVTIDKRTVNGCQAGVYGRPQTFEKHAHGSS